MKKFLLALAFLFPLVLQAQTVDVTTQNGSKVQVNLTVVKDSVVFDHVTLTNWVDSTRWHDSTRWSEAPPTQPPVVTPPAPIPPVVASQCLEGTGSLTTLIGTQTKRYDSRTSPLPANSRVKATGATWTAVDAYAINYSSGDGGCWSGGTIKGTWNQATTVWDVYHSTFAMYVYGTKNRVENLRVDNYGDAVRFNKTTNWKLYASYFTNIHDDCVENDMLASGVIDDVLMEGCYVPISVRSGSSDLATVNGSKDTLTVQNSLVWAKVFPFTANAANTSAGFIKAENREPAKNIRMVLTNNIFRHDGRLGSGSYCLNQHGMVTRASGNILVWLGGGTYPCTLPVGWTITTDVKVWDTAVAAWKVRHGYTP